MSPDTVGGVGGGGGGGDIIILFIEPTSWPQVRNPSLKGTLHSYHFIRNISSPELSVAPIILSG